MRDDKGNDVADQFPVQTNQAPTAVDAFVADRQTMWHFFNRLTMIAVIALVILLVGMAVFLV